MSIDEKVIFCVFGGYDFYPGGGMEDYIGYSKTQEGAVKMIERIHKKKNNSYGWYQVAKTGTKGLVLVLDYFVQKGELKSKHIG